MEYRKADQLAEKILQAIVWGDYEVGSLLPKEADLATGHAVSRSVVREALKKLEVHRLVRPVRRKGTVVLDPFASLSPEVIRAMVVPRAGRVDRRELGYVLELRALLDVEMTALAAERRTEEDLARLDRTVAALDVLKARGDRRRYAAAAEDLALAIAHATQ